MFMKAVTRTPRARAWVRATPISPIPVLGRAPTTIPPAQKKTRPKVPMASARIRRESGMETSVRVGDHKLTRCLLESSRGTIPAEEQAGVDPPEAEGVAEQVLGVGITPLPGQIVQVAGRVRGLQVDGGRQPTVGTGQGADR